MELTREKQEKILKGMTKDQLVMICLVLVDQLQVTSSLMETSLRGVKMKETLKYIDDLQTTILNTHQAFLVNDLETAQIEITSIIVDDPNLYLREKGLW